MKEIFLSPSKVDTFLGCRRLYFYKYVKKISVPPSKYFLIGNLGHLALELFHKGIHKNASSIDRCDFLAHCFEKAVKKYDALSIIKNGRLITRNDLYDIKEMMLNYLKLLKKTGMPDVVSVEKMAEIHLKNGITIRMKADRLDSLGDQEYKVVDYKTSARPASRKDELASVQLPTYGLWAKRIMGSDIKVHGEYQYLRHVDKKKGVHTFEITNEMIRAAIKEYKRIAKILRDGCDFIPNYKYRFCRSCDYKHICLKED